MSLDTQVSALATGVGASLKTTNTTVATKQATLVSGTNIKTINGSSVLGSGDLTVTASYSLPTASTTVLGGVKVGTNLSIDGNGVLSANDTSIGWSEITSKPTTIAGYGITDATPSSHIGATGTAHGNSTASVAGFMSSTDKTKLDGIASGATANTGTVTSVATSGAITGGTITTSGTISHSTDDGYLHIPATGTTNDGKFLKAGATAGSISWVSASEVIGIADLNNVAITSPATNQGIIYNGTSWVNGNGVASSCTGNATTATTSTNLANGSAGTIPYQSASGTTAMLASGTSGYVLQCNGASAPSWVAPPSGGITLAQAQAYDIGVNQTWQDVKASRAMGTTYTNTTGKPIAVSVGTNSGTNSINYTYLYVSGLLVGADTNQGGNSWRTTVEAIVPNGATYSCSNSGNSYAAWYELR